MRHGELGERSPLLVAALGAVLLLVAVGWHARELLVLDSPVGPLVAVLLDGVPALGLVYGGYRLSGTDLGLRGLSTVLVWCLAGALLFLTVIGATLIVRAVEGRVVSEPVFALLVAAEAGAIAGLVAGYYAARARRDARRVRTANDALAFVNELVRHDLRNDLAVIEGQADLLVADRPSGDADLDTTPGDPAVIGDKAEEALARIETSRAIAETLTGEPNLEAVDLVGLVEEMATRIDDAFGVQVRTDLPEEARVTANAGLRSVVDNLLENAVEHNDADEPTVAVSVRTGAETARLTVRDNGPGIPEKRRATLFETRGDDTGGSGLALVRRLVEAYGGDVWVEGNEPRGSAFVVELPRAVDGGR
ncbi:MAG: ATP-binding protein [Haloarculaceae archaeon]